MFDSPTISDQSQELSDQLERFVHHLLQWLDDQINKRLVGTFLLTLGAVVTFIHIKLRRVRSENRVPVSRNVQIMARSLTPR